MTARPHFLPPPQVLWECMELAATITDGYVNEAWLRKWKDEHADTVEWLQANGGLYLNQGDPGTIRP